MLFCRFKIRKWVDKRFKCSHEHAVPIYIPFKHFFILFEFTIIFFLLIQSFAARRFFKSFDFLLIPQSCFMKTFYFNFSTKIFFIQDFICTHFNPSVRFFKNSFIFFITERELKK